MFLALLWEELRKLKLASRLKTSDKINMDNTIAGSFNVHTFLEGNLIKPLLFRQKYMDINYTNIYCKPVR